MRTTFRDFKIQVRDQGAGPPIVFLHNGGASNRIWESQVASLANKHRCVAVDLLGFGSSDKPYIGYTLPLYVDMLSTILSSLDIEGAILAGNCVGSAAALHFALENPNRVRGLFLCNLLTERSLRAGVFGLLHRAAFRWNVIGNLLNRDLSLSLPSVLCRYVVRFQLSNDANIPVDLERHLVSLYRHYAQVRVLGNLLHHMDTYAVLDQVRRPANFPETWLLWGEHNRILPLDQGRCFADSFPADRFHTVRDAAHLPMVERPDQVSAELLRLVQRVDQRDLGRVS